TNDVGYLPASGCAVRMGNVILTCCSRSGSGSGPRVAPNGSRHYIDDGTGAFIARKCQISWRNFARNSRFTFVNTGIGGQFEMVSNELVFTSSSIGPAGTDSPNISINDCKI